MLPPLTRIGRDVAYLTIGLATSVIAFAVWVAVLTASLTLAIFIVGLPVIIGGAVLFRWTAELDRRNAALVYGRPVRGRYLDHRADTLFGRLTATLRDPQTWRDLSWLTVHSILGFAFGVAALSLVAGVLGVATLPAWYWAVPDGVEFGLWNVDSLPLAFASALLAIPLAFFSVYALRAMAVVHAALAAELLGA